jgi:tetratricopeptide (TPR) repeat protein
MHTPSIRGAVFVAAGEHVSANVLIAKLREDGLTSDADPRSLRGFGEDGLVGVVVHPERDGWFAIVDSADGAQGIGAGEWCRFTFIANHLHTKAIWWRVYSPELALGVFFDRGSSFLEVVAGDAARVEAWLDELEVPFAAAVPPAECGPEVLAVTIAYAAEKYRNGPDAELALRLRGLAEALERGDAEWLLEHVQALGDEWRPLALGVIRAAREGAWRRCLETLGERFLAGRPSVRGRVSEMTLEEEVMRRLAEISENDERFLVYLERLDAIETEAERRSDHAHTGGVERIAYALLVAGENSRAFACFRRLVMRTPEPHWIHVNKSLYTLLMTIEGPIGIEGEVLELVRAVEARRSELGDEAADAVDYNLACVYARAGQTDEALRTLARCRTIFRQNPSPEADNDLALIHEHPEFLAILARARTDESEDEDDEDEDEDDDEEEENAVPYVPPPDRAIPRLTMSFRDGERDDDLVDRLGGRPVVPPGTAWPHSPNRPMQLVLQLVGKAAGGFIDLGDVTIVQVFADLEGDFYEEPYNTVLLHRDPCTLVLSAPPGLELEPVQRIELTPSDDDRILLDVEWVDEDDPLHDEWNAAHRHAWKDKVWGVPVGANLDPEQEDSQGRPMKCLAQLLSYDDWFLWSVFVAEDMSEARLECVRG